MKKKVFVLGDSTCIYYSPYLLPLLNTDYECHTKKGRAEAMKDLDTPVKANAGGTNEILRFFKLEEEKGNFNYDYLLFNAGLHDLVYKFNKETNVLADHPTNSVEKYCENLNKIIDKMAQYNIKCVFMTSTPIDEERHNSRVKFKRYTADVLRYNAAAVEVMKERGVPVIDLYTFSMGLEGEKFRDHAHFTEENAEKQAHFINEEFRKILENY